MNLSLQLATSRSLHTAQSMRGLEQRIAEAGGPDSHALMQRAGQAVFACARTHWPEAAIWRIFCGSGNNGGDGYVVARLALQAGIAVQLIRIGVPGSAAEAVAARAEWLRSGGESSLADLAGMLAPALQIDCVFGIGLSRAPAGAYQAGIEAINAATCPTLSVDVPSGLDADTGANPGVCVNANMTLALIGWKQGHFTAQAAAKVGKLRLDGLGLSIQEERSVRLIDAAEIQRMLPPRSRIAHKGHHGHVLVIGGDHGMGGAVLLAGEAALRAGAGWVTIATRADHVGACLARRPEIMVRACEDFESALPLLENASVVAVGPGLGTQDWGRALLQAALQSGKPLVLDADALNLLAEMRTPVPADSICTPHPGEAARLLDCAVGELERDRYAALHTLLQRCGNAVVLKGSGTLVGGKEGDIEVCPIGNPGMASAGMGDALTGVIAAFRAQGLSAFDAARAGVWAHAHAADLAASAHGERGLLASDLIARLAQVVNP